MMTSPKGTAQQWRVAAPAPLLLATKLFPPPVRPGAVARPRLIARLDAALAAPLTVIVAPPGSGKSSLLAEWLASVERSAQHGERPGTGPALRSAWLALDGGDNDPATFGRYLIAALRRAAPEIGAETLELIDSPRPAPLAAALGPLVNELAHATGTLALVLDDFHALSDPEVLAGVSFLCEHGPPCLHLVLAGRSDPPLPLARMRARRQLVELRAADLRFTPGEARALLNDSFGLALSSEQLGTLEARTEGWAAGLQLAALFLRDRPDPAAVVRGFGGDTRYIFDYLAAEVIDGLPTHLRDFLLRTAVLPRLCGALCDAALGIAQPEGGADHGYSSLILAELERRNLFLLPLDDRREWYRYHHLFADALRAQLRRGAAPDELAALHRRAGAWFAARGEVAEAVDQLLAGGEHAGAGALIAAHSRAMLFAGHLATVRGWMAALPPALIRADTALAIAAAWSAIFDSDMAAGAVLAQAAEAAVAATTPQSPPADLLALRSLLFSVTERHEAAARVGEQALEALPPDSPVRPIVIAGQTFSALLAGDIAGGERAARAALATLPEQPATLLLRAHFRTMLGIAARMRGRMREAAGHFDQAIALLDESPVPVPIPTALPTLNEAAVTRYLLDDLPGAAALAARAAGYAAEAGDRSLALPLRWLEARMLAAHGETTAAVELMELAALAGSQAPPLRRAIVHAERVRLHLRLGNLRAAESAAAELHALEGGGALPSPYPEIGLTGPRLLLGQGRTREALAALDVVLADAERAGHGQLLAQALALRAAALSAAGDGPAAESELARAVALAAAAPAPRLLLDEGATVLALLQAGGWRREAHPDAVAFARERLGVAETDGGQVAPALPEPLTPRELDVLRLLGAGRSNRGIAEVLVVAEGTVKRHVANLCAKLGVESRLEAVARARLLGLLQ